MAPARGTRAAAEPREPWFVYVARCSDGTLYTGIARDVAARIRAHDAGKGARYTRGRGPLAVHAVRRCASHGDALRVELAVKRLPREAKEDLANPRRFAALARRALTSPPARTSIRGREVAVPKPRTPRPRRS